jgi:hypothetical protein
VARLDELVDEADETRERMRGRPHTLRRRNACIFSVMVGDPWWKIPGGILGRICCRDPELRSAVETLGSPVEEVQMTDHAECRWLANDKVVIVWTTTCKTDHCDCRR